MRSRATMAAGKDTLGPMCRPTAFNDGSQASQRAFSYNSFHPWQSSDIDRHRPSVEDPSVGVWDSLSRRLVVGLQDVLVEELVCRHAEELVLHTWMMRYSCFQTASDEIPAAKILRRQGATCETCQAERKAQSSLWVASCHPGMLLSPHRSSNSCMA